MAPGPAASWNRITLTMTEGVAAAAALGIWPLREQGNKLAWAATAHSFGQRLVTAAAAVQ